MGIGKAKALAAVSLHKLCYIDLFQLKLSDSNSMLDARAGYGTIQLKLEAKQ